MSWASFPNDAAITRLVGAMLLEQNDEWSLNCRYVQLEGLQSLCDAVPIVENYVIHDITTALPVSSTR